MTAVALKLKAGFAKWDDGLVQLENGVLKREDAQPGDAEWCLNQDGKPSVLMISCPCGCKEVIHVPVAKNHGGHGWEWNDSVEKPTLRPSILRTSGCRWHGYLTKGVLTAC